MPRGRCVGVLGLRFALPQGVAASFWPAVAAVAVREDVAASLLLAVAAAEIRSFQAVHLTCMIVTVSGNLPHIDFTAARTTSSRPALGGHTPTYSVVGPSEINILRLQAPPCLVGLHLDERAGLSSRQFAPRFPSVRHAALRFPSGSHGILPVGLSRAMDWLFGGSTAHVVRRLFNVRRFAESGTLGTSSDFLTGRFHVGQDVFPEQWRLVSSFKDPCLHRVVDNSLLLTVLSVQIFLEVVGTPRTRDFPSLQLCMPPSHFLHAGFFAVAGETRSFHPLVL